MQNVSAPDESYRAFWVAWTLYAGLAVVVTLAVGGVAARVWLVNPIIRSQRAQAGRIVRAIKATAERAPCK